MWGFYLTKCFEYFAELPRHKKYILFFCVLGLNSLFSYELLHSACVQYSHLKKMRPPKIYKSRECQPLTSFALLKVARRSGINQIALKNPAKEDKNICSINLSGEGSFDSVCNFLALLGSHQLHSLELTKRNISMVIYGFCSCDHF